MMMIMVMVSRAASWAMQSLLLTWLQLRFTVGAECPPMTALYAEKPKSWIWTDFRSAFAVQTMVTHQNLHQSGFSVHLLRTMTYHWPFVLDCSATVCPIRLGDSRSASHLIMAKACCPALVSHSKVTECVLTGLPYFWDAMSQGYYVSRLLSLKAAVSQACCVM